MGGQGSAERNWPGLSGRSSSSRRRRERCPKGLFAIKRSIPEEGRARTAPAGEEGPRGAEEPGLGTEGRTALGAQPWEHSGASTGRQSQP